jgi:predicted metal-dependent phosphoesterase TrpH
VPLLPTTPERGAVLRPKEFPLTAAQRSRPFGIDLHTHSTASDGLASPAELMALAAAAGLSTIALTDHDTTAGLAAAAAALPAGMTLIPGAEISCATPDPDPAKPPISLHMLAYLFDPGEPEFARVRAEMRESRVGRARRMVDLLAADGHPVSWADVSALTAGTVGRPHVAQALLRAGLISSMDEAFTPDWIGTGGRYWAGKMELDALAGIRLISGAGGVSVFAHPFAWARGRTVQADVIRAMAAAGLGGVEVDHPDHTPAAREQLRALADELDLLVTGSSDFHGASKPQLVGAETTDPDQLAALIAAATGVEPVRGPGAAR